MDSGAELKFAKLLDKHNINWIKNNGETIFNYIDGLGKSRKYIPDFYLIDYNYWVEVKGKYYEDALVPFKLASVPNIEIIYSDNIILPSFIGARER